MATTTNYGWTTPDDTALVKDGASAIRTLGSSVDTTTKNLNPETTLGDISFRSSTSNVNTRLGIGSTGNILTVAGGVPTWAAPGGGGGTDLISTTTIGTTVSTVAVSSAFSATYDNYLILISGGVGSTNSNLTLQLGSTTSGYYWFGYYGLASSSTINGMNGNGTANFSFVGNGSTNSLSTIITVLAPNLAKRTHVMAAGSRSNSAVNPAINRLDGFEDSNTQHTAFTIGCDAGTMTGGTIRVYGYKN
jgi:hypothetical protein